jgi:hypothetical protein
MNFNFKNLSDFVEIRNSSKVRASNLQYLIIKSFFLKIWINFNTEINPTVGSNSQKFKTKA